MGRPASLLLAAALAASLASSCVRADGDRELASLAEVRREQALDVAARAGLPDRVGRVLAKAAGSVAATYTVAYEAGATRITIFAKPPLRRIDVSAEGRADQRTISTPGETLVCRRRNVRQWRCESAPATEGPGAFDPRAVADAVDALSAAGAVRVEQREIAGSRSSCLVADASVFCVSAEGVPLLVQGVGDGDLRAVRYRPDAAARDFDRPDR